MTRQQPIREGDCFKSASGTVYKVFDCMRFGAGCWVIDLTDRSQSIFKHDELRRMERVSETVSV